MKKFWKYIAIAAMTAVMVPFTACDDDSELGPKDNTDYESNFVYFETPASTYAQVEYKANGDFMSGLTDPYKLVPVRLTKPAPSNLQVEVAIDETLVNEYNEAHGTEYIFLKGAKIEKTFLNIKAGEFSSVDTISVSFGDHSGFINQENDLILPIVVKGGEGLTPSKSGRIFLTFSATYRPNYMTVPTETKTFKAALLNEGWEETISTINVEDVVALSYNPYEEVTVNIAIDESKVAEYNAANGTSYEFKADAELVSNTMTIGTDSKFGSFAINTGDLEGIANEIAYVIPVTISSVEGAAVEFEGTKTIYVVVKGVGRELSYSQSEYEGSKLDYPIACTVDGSPSYSGGWSSTAWVDIINGDTYDYGYIKPNQLMEIDFGKTVNLTAIWVNSYYSSYCATGMKLETSVDGSKWTDWGDVSHEQSSTGKYYINLSAAEDVRYMRLVFTGGGSSYYGIDIDGMMFFGNK